MNLIFVLTIKNGVATLTRNNMNKKDGLYLKRIFRCTKMKTTALCKCENQEQRAAIEKHYERNNRKNDMSVVSVREFLHERITNKLKSIAKTLPDEGYSMGSIVVVTCCSFIGVDDRRREYAGNSYRATHGSIRIELSVDEFRHMYVIGGLATYISQNQHNKVKKCWWFDGEGKHSRFSIIRVNGYIYEGYHSVDKKSALEGGTRNINRKKEDVKRISAYNKACRKQYSFQDSLDAGNCEPGTRAFIIRCGLDSRKKYRGSFLLKIAEQKSKISLRYVIRMINHNC